MSRQAPPQSPWLWPQLSHHIQYLKAGNLYISTAPSIRSALSTIAPTCRPGSISKFPSRLPRLNGRLFRRIISLYILRYLPSNTMTCILGFREAGGVSNEVQCKQTQMQVSEYTHITFLTMSWNFDAVREDIFSLRLHHFTKHFSSTSPVCHSSYCDNPT